MDRRSRRVLALMVLVGSMMLGTLATAAPVYAGTCYSYSSSTVSRSTASDKLTVTAYFTTKGYCAGSYFTKQYSSVTKIVATYANTAGLTWAKNYINAAATYDTYAADGPYCTSPLQGSCWLNTSSQYCISKGTPPCPMTRTYYPTRNGAAFYVPYRDTNIVRIHCVCGGQGFNLYNRYNMYVGFVVNDGFIFGDHR